LGNPAQLTQKASNHTPSLFDTSTSQGRLLVTMLAAIAEFERELIRERTGEGPARARACALRP
jgi:DNA invertase Pin-like site-specific DNA recombinase